MRVTTSHHRHILLNINLDNFLTTLVLLLVVHSNGIEGIPETQSKLLKLSLNSVSPSVDQTIETIITPSDTCKLIVNNFGSAISNFTLCSIRNSRPIHLCQWCIHTYLRVLETHQLYTATIDEKGNPCKDYFTNLDRIEIVSAAFDYVQNLWKKGNCDNCFEHHVNGSIMARATENTVYFEFLYFETKVCFNAYLNSNETCTECKSNYTKLNDFYLQISGQSTNLCMDIVDTMNTTREVWSNLFNCIPDRKTEVYLHIALGSIAIIPVIFYLLAFLLANKKEAKVLSQRRLAEVFAGSSGGASQSSSSSKIRSRRLSTSDNDENDLSIK